MTKFTINLQNVENEISEYLTQLSVKTFITNNNGDYGVNRYAEDALIGILNLVIPGKFENTNHIYKNFPAIDLIDKKKRVAIQITSDNSLYKIKDAIEKFFKHELYMRSDVLYIYLITYREKKYNQRLIDEHIKYCIKTYSKTLNSKFEFDVTKNILDSSQVLSKIRSKSDLKFSQRILNEMRAQFERLESEEDLSKYYDELRAKYDELVMNDENGMKLSDIYVEPLISFHGNCIIDSRKEELLNDNNLEAFSIKSRVQSDKYLSNYFLQQKQHEYLIQSKVLLLLGFPGQGKTSLCKRFLHDFLSQRNLKKNIFFFKLKDIPNTHNLVTNPFNTLYETIKQNLGKSVEINSFRNSVIVLDGLDELFMKEGLKLDDIEWFCLSLIRDVERISELQVIITSRKHYVNIDRLLSEKILIAQLEPLSFIQQKKWLKNYKYFHPETWLTVNDIKEKGDTYLGEMMEQPILLHIIASLNANVSSDTTRAELYNQLFTQIIERKYSKDGQIQILKGITIKDLRGLIQEIAFAIYQTGDGYISKSDLLKNKIVQGYLSKFPSQDFRENLKGVMVSFYFNEREVLNPKDHTQNFVVEFLHKSLEEYMVAEKIVNTLISSFNNKDTYDNYIINDYIDSLKLINSLYANKPISSEVSEYIVEILNASDRTAVKTMGTRICGFLEQMVDCDFIYEFNCQRKQTPILTSLYSFSGVWSLLRNIFPVNNIVRGDISAKIFSYITFIESCFLECDYGNVNYQVFHGFEIWGFGSFSNTEIENLVLVESTFNVSAFLHITFSDCNFFESSFGGIIKDCDFHNCIFVDMTFTEVYFTDVRFRGVSFKGCNFSDCDFKNVSFSEVLPEHFYGVTVDFDTLLFLLRENLPLNLQLFEGVIYNNMKHAISDKFIQDLLGQNIEEFNSILPM